LKPQHTHKMDQTVLVTGGAGFIGSHTVLELLQAGFDVIVLDNFLNSDPSVLARIKSLAQEPLSLGLSLKHIEMDVRDEAGLIEVFKAHRIAGVIHFAGLKAVAESFQQPLAYWDTNVGGTMALARVMKRFDVNHLVFSSSALVYGLPKLIPIQENSELDAVNPYGRTKLICEKFLTDVCFADSRFNVALLRYFNPVGAHSSGLLGESPKGIPNNLMPLVCQVASGERAQLSIFGDDYDTPDGSCIRDYIHVMDLAQGHVLTLKSMLGLLGLPTLSGLSVLNFGTGQGVSVKELVDCFEAVNGVKVPHSIAPRRDGDVPILVANPNKAFESLGWKANRNLISMCQDAWRWQQQNGLHL
jgi:UDP-glucose 4-epimerase